MSRNETPTASRSPRHEELLGLAYEYVLDHGLERLSLRPLAAATGTSPRVLLYLFGSKDGLVRALLARIRSDQLALLTEALGHDFGREPDDREPSAHDLADRMWAMLSAPEQRPVVRLTYEAFLASLQHEPGPWSGFAAEQITDWLGALRAAQPRTRTDIATARATHALALVRGLLLDLLACEDLPRVRSALRPH